MVVSLVGSLLAVGSGPAMADDLRGDLRVMRPDGTVLRISSGSADAWWDDYYRARCVSCKGPHQAALLLNEVEVALGTRFSAAPRYLLLPEALELGWPYAWLFYPSTNHTPAFVVRRGGIRTGGRGLQWDVWMPATARMEGLILHCASEPSPRPEESVGDPAGARLLAWLLVGITFLAFTWWLVRIGRKRHTTSERDPVCSLPDGRTVRRPAPRH